MNQFTLKPTYSLSFPGFKFHFIKLQINIIAQGIIIKQQTFFMKRICYQLFSSQKYFIDQKYQNIYLESQNQLGSLSYASRILFEKKVEMSYIKSRFSSLWADTKKCGLDISIKKQEPEVLGHLREEFRQMGALMQTQKPLQVPWFPRQIKDLDKIGKVLLEVKDQVNNDHPQFSDPTYRERRNLIANIAGKYKIGQKIPDVPYTKEQIDLWRSIYAKLRKHHKNLLSQHFQNQLIKLQQQFSFSQRIPQFNDLSSYLKSKTGFILKPTHGILSQREFLNCLAFRVFCCTQYLRNTSTPDYTPEPDVIHQVIGHVPMFADPDVAELSQEIGLLSLGASDTQIAQLGALYTYTLEFGVCKEGNQTLAYGAGIASSIGQIQHLKSQKARFKPFEPLVDCDIAYPIQEFQHCYRVTESFEQSLKDLRAYGLSVMKPFTTFYNFEKQIVEYDRNIEGIENRRLWPKF